jgi:predicted regulator of Ras-like GTPase activity (Roadblock/LC7/MglB family)
MTSYALNENETKQCQKRLAQLVNDSDAIVASVLSSPDGLLLAQASLPNIALEADSVAAMSSSVISLTDALAGQAGQAMSDKVISDSKDSSLVILHAGSLILTVIGKADANMGMVLTSSQRVAEEIVEAVAAAAQEPDDDGVFSFDPEALLARVMKEAEEMRKKA